ncbi:hypothetical protein RUM43_013333 [Polyplax serrata]|uniref:Uncharacterized protein n=1 Tax=Polyplax serrata TaxID=468196 RepID=A0AAN8RY93_POLSC
MSTVVDSEVSHLMSLVHVTDILTHCVRSLHRERMVRIVRSVGDRSASRPSQVAAYCSTWYGHTIKSQEERDGSTKVRHTAPECRYLAPEGRKRVVPRRKGAHIPR